MNKNGWGLRAELGFLLLFLVCLLISTIGLHKMGLVGNNSSGVEEDFSVYTRGTGNYDYNALENRVESAARKYYQDKYYNNNDTVIISVDTLKNSGYLSPIYDSRNKECKGYAKVLNGNTVVSYIKCSVYKTSGYSEDYE